MHGVGKKSQICVFNSDLHHPKDRLQTTMSSLTYSLLLTKTTVCSFLAMITINLYADVLNEIASCCR